MSKKTIVLADSSYTIRRIVELSFSEEKNIELVTFENSLNLREKLLEVRPHIVLVDIKLPEFSGYDVCKFVQETESLAHTRVFLLKGGFEPIDENLLKGLEYVDIITKPFDSNALVANIKKLLAEMDARTSLAMSDEMPSSFPEDLSEIGAMPDSEREINFSDVKVEIDSEEPMGDEEVVRIPGPYTDEDIQPSEEITRAQPEKDMLIPAGEEDEKDADINPFEEDGGETQVRRSTGSPGSPGSLTEEELNIKKNIKFQESELQIGSVTVEEMNIKKRIEERQRQARKRELPDMGEDEAAAMDEDTSEMFSDSKLDSASDVLIGESEESPAAESLDVETIEMESKPGASAGMETEVGDDLFAFAAEEVRPKPAPRRVTPSFQVPTEDEESLFAPESGMPEIKYESGPEIPGIMDMEPGEPEEPEPEFAPMEEPQVIEMETEPEPPPVELFAAGKTKTPETGREDEFGVLEDIPHDSLDVQYEQEPYVQEERAVFEPGFEPMEFHDARAYEAPPVKTGIKPPSPPPPPQVKKAQIPVSKPGKTAFPPPPPSPKPTPQPPPGGVKEKAKPAAAKPTESPVGIKEEEVLHRVEDKMTHAIKEMLWEIVPPLAEKIINKEIEALKSEAEKTFKK